MSTSILKEITKLSGRENYEGWLFQMSVYSMRADVAYTELLDPASAHRFPCRRLVADHITLADDPRGPIGTHLPVNGPEYDAAVKKDQSFYCDLVAKTELDAEQFIRGRPNQLMGLGTAVWDAFANEYGSETNCRRLPLRQQPFSLAS
jgi:hypothetical protein